MLYKNTSKASIRLAENNFLAPGAEIELSEDDLKNPEIVKMKSWDWLIPIAETVIGNVIQGAITPKATSRKNVKKPKTDEENGIATHNKAIEDAIKRATLEKRTWNPMDDAAPEGEPDYLGPPKAIDTTKQYGNAELVYDANSHPVTHMGGDSGDEDPTAKPAYIPHHPDDLTKFNTPPPTIPPVKKPPTAKKAPARKPKKGKP